MVRRRYRGSPDNCIALLHSRKHELISLLQPWIPGQACTTESRSRRAPRRKSLWRLNTTLWQQSGFGSEELIFFEKWDNRKKNI